MKAWGATLDPTGKSGVSPPLPHPTSPTHSIDHLNLYLSPPFTHTHPTSQIRFLGDPSGKFTKDLDLTFDSAAVFGNDRSKRYALVVEDGKVKSAHVEPDNTGVKGASLPPKLIFPTLLIILCCTQTPPPRKSSDSFPLRHAHA